MHALNHLSPLQFTLKHTEALFSSVCIQNILSRFYSPILLLRFSPLNLHGQGQTCWYTEKKKGHREP